jgi:hypothetical protein
VREAPLITSLHQDQTSSRDDNGGNQITAWKIDIACLAILFFDMNFTGTLLIAHKPKSLIESN